MRRIPYGDTLKKWERYHYDSKGELGRLWFYFRDTVSVEEMKENFHAHHAQKWKTSSPYVGFDSVVHCPLGESVVLTSPRAQHPIKGIRDMRLVWHWFGRFKIISVLNTNGFIQDELLKKVGKDISQEWMEGDFVTLRTPRHYMGFVVSPLPHIETYNRKGKLVGRSGFINRPLDFFCSAAPNNWLDGEWYRSTQPGARLMGQIMGIYYPPMTGISEHSFDVLLYEKPKEQGISVAEYTLELLAPKEPDSETQEAFKDMKHFVEELRFHSFNPLYTTDMRIMTGRYFRVTVNRCGWLVEDYMDINN